MATYNLLEQSEEDTLHKSRLLFVEEKPFKRLTKRLLTPNSLIPTPTSLLTPPPDASSTEPEKSAQEQLEARRQFREDVLLDFAAFESSLARIQFLLSSNERERARYVAEKERILTSAQQVRESTAELRGQLAEAQRTLALRKEYDELADKITSNRLLRPREDQHANLQRLRKEIEELQEESEVYAVTWAERREQFGRIVEEGVRLRRLIRDEKDEAERREGMDGGDDGDEDGSTSKGDRSGGVTPMHTNQGTPMSTETPGAVSQDGALESGETSTARGDETPGRKEEYKDEIEEGEDVSMGEQAGVSTPAQHSEIEEGETIDAMKMDTT